MNKNCYMCFNTLSVTLTGYNVLILEVPEIELENCTQFQLRIVQDIPIGIDSDTIVAIATGDCSSYTIIEPCCANNVYADQIRKFGFYLVRFGIDTNCFILAGGWRLCRTAHNFSYAPPPPPPPESTARKTATKQTKKVEVKKDE